MGDRMRDEGGRRRSVGDRVRDGAQGGRNEGDGMPEREPMSPRLRDLGAAGRLGVAAGVLVLLGGLGASLVHLEGQLSGRDERPGLSLDDLRGAYHGIRTRAPLRTALERGHPGDLPEAEDLPGADRDALLAWLQGNRLSEDYDSLDLGEAAPAEILARRCLPCHSRRAKRDDDLGSRLPLDYWDDVKRLAVSRDVHPLPAEVLTATTHTHALSLGMLFLVTSLLAWLTSWPRRWTEPLIAIAGISLLTDLSSWWLARSIPGFLWGIAGGGVGLFTSLTLLLLSILLDLLLPRRARGG